MKYVNLGKNGPKISTIGFGAWGISGRDWGTTDDKKSKLAIHEALDSGVNFIDTADTYGFGHSEELIAEVLDERGRKDEVVIATKAGNNFYPYLGKEYDSTPANPDYSKKHLIFAAEQSLKRLRVDVIDLLQLHSPSAELMENEETWEALKLLKEQGKIKLAGLSVQSFKETEHAYILDKRRDVLDVLQIRYNLLERGAETVLLPKAMEYGLGIIVRIPLLFGLLAGKFNRESRFGDNDHRRMNLSHEKLDKYLMQLDKIKSFFELHNEYSMAQLALRFCVSHPACHVAIPGGKTPEQVKENIAASEIEIDHKEFPGL
ncbi:MAG: aldo/keto reductase [Ignavibacteria bacterium CG2_30_36_16]|nr:aldo/keto reductase [Ignavibacteria bacterium]OIP57705.1 MAG: aldo/keto reductase [Ignavibacteria bacterium CG2_30_36_16]PJB01919.1 MAG: aldo/keto reductase [Ignavibacteria bacterium CG_4_9_14_3_um_filter_36_18]